MNTFFNSTDWINEHLYTLKNKYLSQIENLNDLREHRFSKKECLNILNEHGLTQKGWWARYPVRAVEETQIMACNTSASIRAENKTLIFDEWIKTNYGSNFLVEIRTKGFPHKMPEVFVREPYIKPNIDFHMYEDHSVCLMHSDDHSSKNSILLYRNQAAAWCFAYKVYINTDIWPAAEHSH